jgi:hypothetical protein
MGLFDDVKAISRREVKDAIQAAFINTNKIASGKTLAQTDVLLVEENGRLRIIVEGPETIEFIDKGRPLVHPHLLVKSLSGWRLVSWIIMLFRLLSLLVGMVSPPYLS